MKNKFIPATEKNIKIFKEKHFNVLLNDMKKENIKLYKNNPEEMPTYNELKEDLEWSFKCKNMSNHQTIVPNTNFDFFTYIKNITNSEIENEMIILLDENKNIIGNKIVSNGTTIDVVDDEGPGHKVWKYILSNPNAKYFIHIHNHPRIIVAKPSLSDKFQMVRHKMIGNLFHVKLLDACIVSEFDFYSQFQHEQNDKTKPILKYWETNVFPDDMIYKNLPIWSILRKSLED